MEKNSASCTKKKQCCGEEIYKTVSNLEDEGSLRLAREANSFVVKKIPTKRDNYLSPSLYTFNYFTGSRYHCKRDQGRETGTEIAFRN